MKTIGKYEIRSFLGSGAMGSVYKVIIPVIQKVAAVKILKPTSALLKKMGLKMLQDQFIREAALIANIRHPNVVEVWNIEKEDDSLFYLMEYFSHNLGTLIGEAYWADAPSRIVTVKKTTQVITDLLEGLSRLHHANIVHQDIKPFNIMLTDDGHVKIVDFGLSRKKDEVLDEMDELFVGTKGYAAPEQAISSKTVDHRADLHAAGVILYRMLTGILPADDPVLPSQLNPEIAPFWDRFILKAMAKDPDERFDSARKMQIALQKNYDRYLQNKQRDCRMKVEESLEFQAEKPKLEEIRLRSKSKRIPAKNAASIFNLDELYQPLTYCRNDFKVIEDGIVKDFITGRIWQQAGTPYSMTWEQAKEYIDCLNRQKFKGYDNWRLPTVNELLSLLRPSQPGEDFCLGSAFSKTQKWIWSGDSRSKKAAWIVNMEMGFVTSYDVMDFLYVKGISSS